MVTGAALATVNRLPVLLLPGDVFATRIPDPVLQQIEVPSNGDVSANDSFAPSADIGTGLTVPNSSYPRAFRPCEF